MSTFTFGRLTLQEPFRVQESVDRGHRKLRLTGQEASPPLTAAQLNRIHDDILSLPRDGVVPVRFTDKADLDGLYEIIDASARLGNWFGDVLVCDWSFDLRRWTDSDDSEVESRLTGAGRNTSWAVTAERWHAPPIGAYGYIVGNTSPSTVSRASEDGTVVVRRSLSSDYDPRYIIDLANWYSGSSRVLVSGTPIYGTRADAAVTAVSLSNGIVKVEPLSDGRLNVSAWDSGAWVTKTWDILVNAANPTFTTVEVLRNTPEDVAIRLTGNDTNGRLNVDLALKRGSRFVTGWIRRHASATLKVALDVAEAGTTETGLVRATADDANGNRYVVGTATTFTADANGGIERATTTSLDFFLGVALNGSLAQVGDQPADLLAQFLGTPAEHVVAVRR